jgi:(1->4)-alpha-D-glucan 1-alpha-D-glucosylmutase
MEKIKIPCSTYRLQLHKDFTFDDAAAIAGYLYNLGISHVYSSPYLQAALGSMHGYDVVSHQRVNEELGGEQAHRNFSQTLGENGLGQILDIVPNHMAIGRENRFWWDVLENGASSRYASFFDIDWHPSERRLRNKVLVPVLGDLFGRVLESDGIKVVRDGMIFRVEAAGQSFPASPLSMAELLSRATRHSRSDGLEFAADSLRRLPRPTPDDRNALLGRNRDLNVIKILLERVCAENSAASLAIDRAVEELNTDYDALDDFLTQQNYRLSYWKTADQQIGYRRFFDVNNLIGLRMERAYVFEETHARVLGWVREGVLDGVRIDHPDGLRDPLEYFERLRAAAPRAWIVGEKILARGELLRPEWPIDGTSGYDFLNMMLGLLVDSVGLKQLTAIYAQFTGAPTHFPTIAHDKKAEVARGALGSDVNRLASIFVDLCESRRNQRDYTRAEIRRCIRELAACFAVYRTYVVPQREEVCDEDRRVIACAVRCAKDNRSDLDPGLLDFFEEVLTLKVTGRLEAEFVLRFQQFTSPVMAKGVEDTAFYCFNRLTALCEVGGDPARDGVTLDDFHAYQQTMQETHPATMTTLSTHDTKRADDVRARLAVLSEMPQRFAATIQDWRRFNAGRQSHALVDANTEMFLYQTLIGAWPIDAERAKAYMLKAMREAKLQTSWVDNNKPYEDALCHLIDEMLADAGFVKELEAFVALVSPAGRVNSLAQTLIKHTAPGVPDLYQGSELWDHSLVDPDNRRPVDYALRRRLLAELGTLDAREILSRMDEGLPKLHVVHAGLLLRRERPEWFGEDAPYTRVNATGTRREHVIAYLRAGSVLTVAPRLSLRLDGDWEETSLAVPEGTWRNRLTQETVQGGLDVRIEDLLRQFPVALLTREKEKAIA